MFRRHFFLIVAVLVVVAMGVAGAFKVMGKKPAATGPGAAAGGPGGGRGGGPGGPGGRGGPGGPGAQVALTTVGQRVFTDRLDVQGVAKGRQSVTLTSSGAQVVDKVRFRSGDHVKQGQVLIELRRDAEDAGIAQAQAQVDLAKSTADRWNKLAAQGLAPAATAEQYQSAYITAQTTLDTAKARLRDRVISAPFSGTIGLSDIAPGALISPGTAIATLDDTAVITVDIDVPDRNLSLVKEGTPIDATTDAFPGEHYSGRIARIDTRIDERSRSFKARAELPNPGDRLKPGMLLHVGIDRGSHPGLAIPEASIQYSAGQASVFVFAPRNPRGGGQGQGGQGQGGQGQGGQGQGGAGPNGQGPGAPAGANPGGQAAGGQGPGGAGRPGGGAGRGIPGTAIQRPIIAGIDECGFVEVKDGLEIGDRIIADGLNKLSPNQAVLATFAGGRGPGAGGPGAGGRGGPGGGAGADRPGGASGQGGAPATAARQGGGRGGADASGGMAARGGSGGGAGGPGMGRGSRAGARGGSAGGVQPAANRCATQAMPARGGAGAGAGRPGGAPDSDGRRGRGGPGGGPALNGGSAPGAGRGRGRGVETVQ